MLHLFHRYLALLLLLFNIFLLTATELNEPHLSAELQIRLQNEQQNNYHNTDWEQLYKKCVGPCKLDDETFCITILNDPDLKQQNNEFYHKIATYYQEGKFVKEAALHPSIERNEELFQVITEKPHLGNYTWWQPGIYQDDKWKSDFTIQLDMKNEQSYTLDNTSILTYLMRNDPHHEWQVELFQHIIVKLLKSKYDFTRIPYILQPKPYSNLKKVKYPWLNILEFGLQEWECLCTKENDLCRVCNTIQHLIKSGMKIRDISFKAPFLKQTSNPLIKDSLHSDSILSDDSCIEKILKMPHTRSGYSLYEIYKMNLNNKTRLYDRSSPLHTFIKMDCNYEIVDYLLTKKIDVNAQDGWGNTALHFAANSFTCFNTTKLLQHGANPYIWNNQKKLPLDITLDNWRAYKHTIINLPILLTYMAQQPNQFNYQCYWHKFLSAFYQRGKDFRYRGFEENEKKALQESIQFFLQETPYHTRSNIITLLSTSVNIADELLTPTQILSSVKKARNYFNQLLQEKSVQLLAQQEQIIKALSK